MRREWIERFNELESEERIIVYLIAASLLVHVMVFTLSHFSWPMPRLDLTNQEWEIQADVLLGGDFGPLPDVTSLPKAEQGEEAAVPKNILPQLPQTVALKQSAPQEEVEAEAGEQSKEKDRAKEAAEEKKEVPNLAIPKKEDNKINEEELLRRAALERLRKEEKFSDKYRAEQRDAIARLKADGATRKASGLSASQLASYEAKVKASVSRCYMLPEAYNLRSANIQTLLAVVLSQNGELVSVDLQKSSGDKVFDNIALKTLKDCAPLPPPPSAVVGKAWTYVFRP